MIRIAQIPQFPNSQVTRESLQSTEKMSSEIRKPCPGIEDLYLGGGGGAEQTAKPHVHHLVDSLGDTAAAYAMVL